MGTLGSPGKGPKSEELELPARSKLTCFEAETPGMASSLTVNLGIKTEPQAA